MSKGYHKLIDEAIQSFWITKAEQSNVLAGKQLDKFLTLLTKVATDAGVPKECIFLKNNQVPGYYRATKDWDFLIVSNKGNLVCAIELKSQVGSYGNNLNNRTEESLGSAEDFWTAFREKSFPSRQSSRMISRETDGASTRMGGTSTSSCASLRRTRESPT